MYQKINSVHENEKTMCMIRIMPRIKQPRIANRDKLPQIRDEDCEPLWVISGKNFSFNENSFIY